MPNFYSFIDLQRNELRQAQVQNLASPGPTTPVAGQLWYDSTNAQLKWYNGTTWVVATGGGSLTPASTVTNAAINDTGVVGTSANYAREDHKHGMPSFAAPVASTAFGATAVTGTSTSVVHSDHTHGTPTHDDAAHAAIHLNAHAAANGSTDAGSQKIINVATPTVGADAANKAYVDGLVQGMQWKNPVRAATTVGISLFGTQTIDGVACIAGDRVLVKNNGAATDNGVYVVAAAGWARATDMDVGAEFVNAAVFVSEGSTLADTAWVCTTNAPISPSITAIAFAQFGASGAPTGPASGDLTGSYPGPTIANAAVTNAKLANMLANSIKGNNTGSSNVPTDLSGSQVVNLLPAFTSVLPGIVPPSGGGTTAFLRADGTFAAPAGGGTVNKYAAALTGTASPETVTHNLNTRDVHVTVLNGASPYTAVEVDWDATTVNTIVIRYSPNLGAGYRVVVLG